MTLSICNVADIIIRSEAGVAPNNVGLSCVGTRRAINSIGTPWPGGPENYAASLVNEDVPPPSS